MHRLKRKAGDSAATSPNPNQQRQSAHFQRTGEIRRRVTSE